MKEIKTRMCSVSLLRTQWQLELLTELMTQENLRRFQVYEEKRSYLIEQRSQALKKFACWLQQMGLQEEMSRLIRQESRKCSKRLHPAKREVSKGAKQSVDGDIPRQEKQFVEGGVS